MSNLPLVSVGIPTYNRPAGLRRTLECITSQTYQNLEIIISDNASFDPQVEKIVREFETRDARIRYYKQEENKGAGFNFNFVFQQAHGEYFMWVADDDLREKNAIEVMLSYFLDADNVVFVGSFFATTNYVTGEVEKNEVPLLATENARFKNFCVLVDTPTPSFIYGLFRTSVVRQTRFVRRDYFDFGDVFFLYEIALLGKMFVVPQVLYYAGVNEIVREPKSFSKLKFPGFKFGYSIFLMETVKLILRSDIFSFREKIYSLLVIHKQVFTFIAHHEKDNLGAFGLAFVNGLMRFVNLALRMLKKRD